MLKKVSNTTPTMASIINGYSTSTQDGYSCDYINGTNTYSTDEVDTGKRWIDSKPIYRKVIQTTIGDAATALNALNCDFVIDLKGWYRTSYDFTWQINNYPGPDNDNYSLRIYRYTSSKEFTVRYGSYAPTSNNITIIIEYTKTTSSNTRNLQESRNLVSEEENFEDIEPIENELKDENR